MYFYTNTKAHISVCDIQCSHNVIPAEIIDWFYSTSRRDADKSTQWAGPRWAQLCVTLGITQLTPGKELSAQFSQNRLLKAGETAENMESVQHFSQPTAETEEFSQQSNQPWSNTPLAKTFQTGTNLCGWRINLHCREGRAELVLELDRAKGCMNINQLYWGKVVMDFIPLKKPWSKTQTLHGWLLHHSMKFFSFLCSSASLIWVFFPSHWKICNLMATALPWQRSDKSLKSMEPIRDKEPRSLSAMWGTAHHCSPSPCWPKWCLCVCPTKVRHLKAKDPWVY